MRYFLSERQKDYLLWRLPLQQLEAAFPASQEMMFHKCITTGIKMKLLRKKDTEIINSSIFGLITKNYKNDRCCDSVRNSLSRNFRKLS